MCDCLHLAFPNWHGSPGMGAGRRLKGPEPDTVDDSICEEPSEFIEGERPRPQGSSPVDEYPETDKYTDIDKQGGGGSGKKGKRGFGSLFEKRSPAKMSQLENSESGVIVRMAKETCAEGLVLSGGGKEGIFIKEVRPESPASKLLSVHEGDQILSATVYFDNVKYEDALQILEHAQPYKMELLLKRKPIKISTLESEPALEFTQVEQGSSLEMREHSKKKRHGDRISWPYFPSFNKSRKSHFKRSHSTTDADDQRKLELSPTTSDTESPIKSQEAVKGRTKKQKIKLSSLKMKGRKSRSVEQSDQDTDILTVECVQVMEIQQSQDELYSPDGLESTSGETPQVYVFESESEKMESTKIKNECSLPDLTCSETKQHKVELIRLDKTLKTTDITVAFSDQESSLTKKSLEEKKKKKEKKERSELKFRIKGKEKKDKQKQDIHVKSSPKSMKIPGADIITSDLSAHDNTLMIPTIVSHTKLGEHQLPIDMSDVGLIRKSPQIGQERDLKETYVKTNLNAQEMHAKVTSITMEPDLQMEIQALKLPTETSIDDVLVQIGKRTATKFKLPRVDLADFVTDEPIKMTDVKIVKMAVKSLKIEDKGLKILPNRDDIEIPGMEDASSTGTKTPVIKQPKTAFTLPVEEIQAQTVQMVIDVDRVKVAVSKLPGFKLPKGDTVGLPAHQEITKKDVNAERVNVTVDTALSKITDIKAQMDTYVKKTDINASPEKLSRSSVTTIKLPKNQLSDLGAHEPITMTEIYHKKRKDEAGRTNEVEIQIELHKREDVEIPGMENIIQKGSPNQVERVKELAVPVPEWPTIKAEESNVIPYTKGLDKKSKKAKMSMPAPNVAVDVPNVEKDIKVQGTEIPEPKLTMSQIKIEKPSVDIKGPSIDVDVNLKKLEMFTLPEFKVQVQPPSVKLKVPSSEVEMPEGAATEMDVKMKKPRMSFGWFSKPEAKAPEVDISLTNVDISLPEGKVEVKEPDMEMKSPEVQIEMKHDIELEGQGSQFKLPKFGLSLPRGKGPEIVLSLSKTDVDVDLPEGRADLQIPDVEVGVPSVEVQIPEAGSKDIDVKMRKPRMSFPKFGFSKPEVKAPEVDISLPEVDISLPEGNVEVKEPEVEMKTSEIQVDVKDTVGSPSRFKMPTLKFPKFGAPSPNVTMEVPDLDKDIKVHGTEIPEPKLTISAINIEKPNIDLKGPSIDINRKKIENVTLPEVKMNVQPPSIELKVPSSEVEMPEGAATEMDVKMKKPRMSFGWFSKPEAKAPEVDISLTNVDISLPEGKVEVKEPDMEMKSPEVQIEMKHDIELEGQGSKFKLPKFGLSLPRGKGPEIGLSLSKTDVDVDLPEGRADLQIPDVEVGVPSVEVQIPEAGSKDIDVKMRKPRMSFPKFGFSKPEVKAPEVDISLPEVDISLPEGNVEVKEPEVEMKTSEIQVDVKDTVGSPSRFKMPTLKFPKFGAPSPNVTMEVPDLDKDIKVHGTEIPEPKLTISAINIEKPNIDLKGPSIDINRKKIENVTLPEVKMNVQPPSIELKVPSSEVEMPEGAATEMDVKMKKPRMSFGWFSKPEAKAPEVDISLTNVDISLPEGKVEVKEPDMEMKSPEVQIEMKHDIELEGQGSQFKLPKFGLSLPRGKGPAVGLSLSKTDVDVDLPEGKADLQLPDVEVGVPSVEVQIPEAGSKDIDVKMRKPRMSFPKFGFSKPEVKAPEVDISLPEVDISLPEGNVEVKEPEVEIKTSEIQVDVKDTVGSPSRFKMPTLKFPKFGAPSPNVTMEVPDLDKDIKVHGTEIPEPKLTISAINIEKPNVDLKGPSIDINRKKIENVTLPEVKMNVQPPSIELKVPSSEVEMPEGAATEMDVKMKKPRMSFGWFSKPEAKAPEVDISLPEVDISLPEGNVEVKEPEVEMKTSEIQVDVKDTVGSPSRFKMPTLKFPKFGAPSPNVTMEVPDLDKDIKVHGTEIPEPKLTISAINIEKPNIDLKGPSIDINRKKIENVTLPEVKMNVQPPSIELKVPSSEVEMPEGAATEMDVKMKKPRMSFGWFSKPEAKAPEVDISLTNVDISLPEGKVEVKEPDMEMKSPEVQIEMKHDIELEGQGSQFKLPKFGLSLPRGKGPAVGLSLSKTDVDVDLPEGKADLQLPDVEVGVPSVEVQIPEAGSKDIDVKMRKPRMSFPKFGFSKPEVKAPEVDISLPEVDISLPEGNVEVKEPEVEMKTSEIQVDVKDTVGSPSRFKMPTLKFPKFGAPSPNVTMEVPDLDKDIKVHGTEIPEPKLTISAINIEKPNIDLKGPSIDINRKKIENVTLPEVKMNVQPPSIELKVPSSEVEMPEGAATEMDVKMKKPRMSFGWFSKPEAKAPEVDISLTNVDISLPEGKVEVKEPDMEMKSPEVQIEMKHDIELEGQGSQFKLPKFGLSLPRGKGPAVGLSLSKTDVDVDLPEGKADLQLPDVEVGVPSVEVQIPEAGSKDIDVKMRKPRMSFPKFGFSKPEVKAPEVDISLPEVDISLPEGNVEVKEPEVEIKTSEIQVDVKDTVGSPSRFKMPTLKFPKFGAPSPNVTMEVPDLDKDIKVHGTEIPEPKLTISAINIEKPNVDLKGPSIDINRKKIENVTLPEVKMNVQPPSIELKVPSSEVEMPEGAATEMDVKMKKPRMSFGWFSKPEAKAPEVDISLTNVDISLPEGKVEVKEPDMEMKSPEVQIEMKHDIELEGQGSQFKLPKFGLSLPRGKGPEIGLSLSKTDVDVDLPEGKADLQLPDVEVGVPSVEVQIPEAGSKDIDVKMRKPRMSFPKFGFSKPEVKAPEVDISLPEVDISLPEGNVEVKEPEVEMKTSEIQVDVKDTVGSPSRFKMPTLKFPKFGAPSPNVTMEVPDLDKDIKVHGTEIPEPKLTISAINIEKPNIDLKGPSIDINRKKIENVTLPEVKMNVQPPSIELKVPSSEVEMPEGAATEMDVKMKKPRMSFGWFSKPEAKALEVDISLTNVDISLPEGKVEVKEPDMEIKSPEVQIEMKHDIELEGQGSQFKLPKFGLSLPRGKGPAVGLSLSKTDVDVDLPEGKADLQLPDVEVGVPSVEVQIPEAGSKDIDVKMRKPRMSFPKFGFSKPEVKAPEVDISLPEVDISLPEGNVEVKEPEVEMKTSEIQVDVKDTVGSPSRFKMPTLKFPKFGAPSPNVTMEVPDLDKDIKVHGTEIPEPKLTISAINIEKPNVDVKGPSIDINRKKIENVTLPEVKMNVQPPSIELKVPSSEVEMPEGAATEMDVKMKKPRMSFGWFSKPEAKAPEVDISLTNVDISLPEGKVEVKEPDMEMKSPEVQIEMKHDIELEGQGSQFKLPKFGLSLPRGKGPEIVLSLSKTDVDVDLPEGKADLQLPDVEVGVPSVEVQIPEAGSKDIDVKMRKPRMSFPKFGFSKPEVKAPEVDISLPEVDISLPEGNVEVKEPEVEMKTPEIQVDVKDTVGSPSRFKMPTLKFPKFGAPSPNVTMEVPDLDKDIKVHGTEIPEPKLTISAINIEKPNVDLKGPSIDINRKKIENVTLPEVKMNVQPPSIELKVPSSEVEMPEGAATEMDVKMKKPRMSFGWFSKPEAKAPEVDISLTNVDISLPEGNVELKEPEVEMKTSEVQVDVKDTVGSPSRFKMPTLKFPKFGAPSPNVTMEVPDLDKDIKVHGTEIPEPKLTISAINIEKPNVDLKGPSIDINRKKIENVTLPEVKMNVQPPSIELKVPSSEVEMPEGAATEMDVKMKKPRMSFGWFSKPEAKALEVDVSLTKVEFSLPEGKVVKESYVEIKAPESQVEMKNEGFSVDGKLQTPDIEDKIFEMGVKKPLITFPKSVFSRSEITAPEIVVIPPNVDISLPEGKEFKVPEVKMKAPEIEVDVKDAVGSPSRFKMPTFKLPTFGTTSKVAVDVSDKEKDIEVPGVEIIDQTLGASIPVDLTEPGDRVDIKGCSELQLHVAGSEGPSVEEGMTIADVDVHDVDSSELTIDDKGHGLPIKGQGSPSKFKLPTFKMPKLSISKSKPQNEHEHDDISPNIILENYEIHVEPQRPEISPKLTLTTFGEVLRSIDVEFYVPALEEVEEKLTGSREEITASRKTKLNAQPSAETQSVQEEEEVKEKSKFVWFKFPTFGPSSPSEYSKILEKEASEKEASEKSPAGDSVAQDSSLTFSVQSSDAFADISSTVTSEQVAPSLASPTKVTVKYSDPIATEIQGNIITSTARTKMISFEPYLAEKVTIPMSSGTSSSSVDTLKLESGTHVITSNIQAIPDTQKATLLTDFGLQTGTAGASSASRSVDDTNKTQSDGQTVIKRHVVREMSGTDKETVVLTRRVTHVFGAEPISDETASSIKQMKETMHSEKMKFFDGAELE
ncbi:neuroblast differentiation-associated protein AHNAK-like isoform X3 [Salvelinus fontinalis]|uniref:neuroblast differentiation-associated protein AHNAK-like isoform X3 n=1 Tax=Salvelinus fontinalis TaxID=8038 RepID=UPI002486BCC6|nr:neuroblast differentiation-associated protein AHNAK-like isoform X3 [Salvelinus fontinalis]